jgi:hypothetical protein
VRQSSHAGKNDPKTSTEGAREQLARVKMKSESGTARLMDWSILSLGFQGFAAPG